MSIVALTLMDDTPGAILPGLLYVAAFLGLPMVVVSYLLLGAGLVIVRANSRAVRLIESMLVVSGLLVAPPLVAAMLVDAEIRAPALAVVAVVRLPAVLVALRYLSAPDAVQHDR